MIRGRHLSGSTWCLRSSPRIASSEAGSESGSPSGATEIFWNAPTGPSLTGSSSARNSVGFRNYAMGAINSWTGTTILVCAPRWALPVPSLSCSRRRTLATPLEGFVGTLPGATHGLTLFGDSAVKLHPDTALLADAAYQGIWTAHRLSLTPHKAAKSALLASVQRMDNRPSAQRRQPIEHVIR